MDGQHHRPRRVPDPCPACGRPMAHVAGTLLPYCRHCALYWQRRRGGWAALYADEEGDLHRRDAACATR